MAERVPGPAHNGEDYAHLMPELTAPLNAEELATEHHSGELHGKALAEQDIITELQAEARELQRQLDGVSIKLADANVRKATYMEAFEIARAIEDGK